MATKKVSGVDTAAKKKPRGKPFTASDAATRGKPFTGKDDPRANKSGSRNKAVVRTQSEMRDLYVMILHEPLGTEYNPEMSRMEMIARQHVIAATKGDADAREKLLDRIWGKAKETLDLTGSMKITQLAEELNDDELATIAASGG